MAAAFWFILTPPPFPRAVAQPFIFGGVLLAYFAVVPLVLLCGRTGRAALNYCRRNPAHAARLDACSRVMAVWSSRAGAAGRIALDAVVFVAAWLACLAILPVAGALAAAGGVAVILWMAVRWALCDQVCKRVSVRYADAQLRSDIHRRYRMTALAELAEEEGVNDAKPGAQACGQRCQICCVRVSTWRLALWLETVALMLCSCTCLPLDVEDDGDDQVAGALGSAVGVVDEDDSKAPAPPLAVGASGGVGVFITPPPTPTGKVTPLPSPSGTTVSIPIPPLTLSAAAHAPSSRSLLGSGAGVSSRVLPINGAAVIDALGGSSRSLAPTGASTAVMGRTAAGGGKLRFATVARTTTRVLAMQKRMQTQRASLAQSALPLDMRHGTLVVTPDADAVGLPTTPRTPRPSADGDSPSSPAFTGDVGPLRSASGGTAEGATLASLDASAGAGASTVIGRVSKRTARGTLQAAPAAVMLSSLPVLAKNDRLVDRDGVFRGRSLITAMDELRRSAAGFKEVGHASAWSVNPLRRGAPGRPRARVGATPADLSPSAPASTPSSPLAGGGGATGTQSSDAGTAQAGWRPNPLSRATSTRIVAPSGGEKTIAVFPPAPVGGGGGGSGASGGGTANANRAAPGGAATGSGWGGWGGFLWGGGGAGGGRRAAAGKLTAAGSDGGGGGGAVDGGDAFAVANPMQQRSRPAGADASIASQPHQPHAGGTAARSSTHSRRFSFSFMAGEVDEPAHAAPSPAPNRAGQRRGSLLAQLGSSLRRASLSVGAADRDDATEWERHFDPLSGQPFAINVATGEIRRDANPGLHPTSMTASMRAVGGRSVEPLAAGRVVVDTGNPRYYGLGPRAVPNAELELPGEHLLAFSAPAGKRAKSVALNARRRAAGIVAGAVLVSNPMPSARRNWCGPLPWQAAAAWWRRRKARSDAAVQVIAEAEAGRDTTTTTKHARAPLSSVVDDLSGLSQGLRIVNPRSGTAAELPSWKLSMLPRTGSEVNLVRKYDIVHSIGDRFLYASTSLMTLGYTFLASSALEALNCVVMPNGCVMTAVWRLSPRTSPYP